MIYTLKRDDMPLLSQWINEKGTFVNKSSFFVGGEGEIRTLEPLLTVTRFPIVRARPTTRLLHVFGVVLCDSNIITQNISFVNTFFKKYLKSFEKISNFSFCIHFQFQDKLNTAYFDEFFDVLAKYDNEKYIYGR